MFGDGGKITRTLSSTVGSGLRSAKSHSDVHSLARAWDSSSSWPLSADEYELVKQIGLGASGKVWLAKCKAMDKEVAVKLMDLEDLNCKLEYLIKEAQVMREQRHPNVLPLYCSFVAKNQLWMVMPFVGAGSLLAVLQSSFPDGLDEQMVSTIGREVLKGLEYMHSNGRIHRDIKAANVLVGQDGRVVVGDFGTTATLERTERSHRFGQGPAVAQTASAWSHRQYLARNTFCGTPCFMAPEVMEQTQGYSTEADVWSFGILLEELATGRAPYENMSLTSVILSTLHDDAPTLDKLHAQRKFSDDLHDVVRQCLQKDPEERPTVSQLLKHKYFKKAGDQALVAKRLLTGEDRSQVTLKERFKSMRLTSMGRGSPKSPLNANFNAYATATLSGDVANALSLLKRLTNPNMKKQRCGLLIPEEELQDCKGVAFGILRRSGVGGVEFGKGSGFVVARRREAPDVHTGEKFAPHYRQMRKTKADDSRVKEGRPGWTAPSYFEMTCGGCGDPWEYDEVEVLVLLDTIEALETFQQEHATIDALLEDEEVEHIHAYGLANDTVVELPLDGGKVKVNNDANARIYGHTIGPVQLLNGEIKSPVEFNPLFKLLGAFTAHPEDIGAKVVGHIDDSGSTLLYRMPMWMYDD